MPTALVLASACQFWSVAILLGGGGLSMLGCRPRRAPALLRLAAIAALLSGVAWLALTLVGMTGEPASLLRADDWQAFFTQPPFGPAWTARLVLLLAGVAILPRARPWPYAAVGLGLAIDQAWLGHAANGLLIGYWIHVVAGLAWVGALTMLVATLVERQEGQIARALALFSTIGLALVALILASGLFNAAAHLTAAADIFGTAYGRLVALKLGLFLAMVGLAIRNRLAAARGAAGIATSVVIEAAIGVLVLGVAAVLGVTEPP